MYLGLSTFTKLQMALMKFLVQQDVTPGLVHLWEVLDAVFPL